MNNLDLEINHFCMVEVYIIILFNSSISIIIYNYSLIIIYLHTKAKRNNNNENNEESIVKNVKVMKRSLCKVSLPSLAF